MRQTHVCGCSWFRQSLAGVRHQLSWCCSAPRKSFCQFSRWAHCCIQWQHTNICCTGLVFQRYETWKGKNAEVCAQLWPACYEPKQSGKSQGRLVCCGPATFCWDAVDKSAKTKIAAHRGCYCKFTFIHSKVLRRCKQDSTQPILWVMLHMVHAANFSESQLLLFFLELHMCFCFGPV